MDKEGYVSGSVTLRPVRIGMAIEPTLDNVKQVADILVNFWGGYFCPILDATDRNASLKIAEHFSLDAVYAVDDSKESKNLGRTQGFFWRGLEEKGPFKRLSEGFNDSLLTPEWALRSDLGGPLSLPSWSSDDSLKTVFSLWFGRYETNNPVSRLFEQRASRARLSSADRLPAGVVNFCTPIKATTLGILQGGARGNGAGLLQMRPDNPTDLILFWNLRAMGVDVFPWVTGEGRRLESLFTAWFARASASFRHFTHEGASHPVFSLWGTNEVPQELEDWIDGSTDGTAGIRYFCENDNLDLGGPRHLITSRFSRTFSISTRRSDGSISVPLPAGPQIPYGSEDEGGILTADIQFYKEGGLSQGVVASIPYLRSYSHIVDTMRNAFVGFERITPDGGRACTVAVHAHEVEIGLANTASLFQHIFEIGGWSCRPSEGGRLVGRVIEMLGGSEQYPGNQPSLRRVLDDAARSSNGRKLSALIQTAKVHKGEWPGSLNFRPDSYPKDVVYGLLLRKLLQPFLEIRCPHCSMKSFVRPADLAADIECEICGDRYPLGLALGLAPGGKNEWVYRLTGNLSAERIAEIMPVSAVLSVLSGVLGRGGQLAHSFGLLISNGKWACEIDIAALVDWSERPLVVIGEVKSYRDSVDKRDLENLVKVQRYLKAHGFECLILAATLKTEFTAEEVSDLRAICDRVDGGGKGSRIYPLLPLVLNGNDLSVPSGHERSPDRWESRFDAFGLAEESCKRNLGLIEMRPVGNRGDGASSIEWQATWP